MMLRRKRQTVTITDDFNRANGAMGVTPVGGVPWQVIAGAWSIAANKASTASPDPAIVAVDIGYSDVDMGADVSPQGNDAIYFRIQDAQNWLRARLREQTTSSTVYCTYATWTRSSHCYSQQSGGVEFDASSQACGGCPNTPCGGWVPYEIGFTCQPDGGSCQLACGTNTFFDYYIDLQRMVAGGLTNIATVHVGTSVSVTHLRAVLSDTTVKVYGTINGVESLLTTQTISNFRTATLHGVGRSSGSSTNGSALDNFTLTGVA
jgi:hypothetical protein